MSRFVCLFFCCRAMFNVLKIVLYCCELNGLLDVESTDMCYIAPLSHNALGCQLFVFLKHSAAVPPLPLLTAAS